MEQQQKPSGDPSPSTLTVQQVNSPPANLGTSRTIREPWLSKLITDLVAELTNYISDFFRVYQRPMLVLAGILALVVVVYLMLAIFAAIDNIPLLKSLLQLIGLVYISWFIYNYLLSGSKRTLLPSRLQQWKNSFIDRSVR